MLAMRRALLALPVRPDARARGRQPLPVHAPICRWRARSRPIVAGDARVRRSAPPRFSPRRIRDAMMEALDVCYPGFELAAHKGYGTPAH